MCRNLDEYPEFGPGRFRKLTEARTWNISLRTNQTFSKYYREFFRDGFFVDEIPVWSGIEGWECGIVARVSTPRHRLTNPPDGIRVVFLDDLALGKSPGKAILVLIESDSELARAIIGAAHNMPVDLIPFLLPDYMRDEGYFVAIRPATFFSQLHLVKNKYTSPQQRGSTFRGIK